MSAPAQQTKQKRINQISVVVFFIIAIVVADICFELVRSVLNTYVFSVDSGRPWQWLLVVIGAFIVFWAYSQYIVKLPIFEAFNPSATVESQVEPSGTG